MLTEPLILRGLWAGRLQPPVHICTCVIFKYFVAFHWLLVLLAARPEIALHYFPLQHWLFENWALLHTPWFMLTAIIHKNNNLVIFIGDWLKATNRLVPAALQWPTDPWAACCHCSLGSGGAAQCHRAPLPPLPPPPWHEHTQAAREEEISPLWYVLCKIKYVHNVCHMIPFVCVCVCVCAYFSAISWALVWKMRQEGSAV